jgi:hypothetical protein
MRKISLFEMFLGTVAFAWVVGAVAVIMLFVAALPAHGLSDPLASIRSFRFTCGTAALVIKPSAGVASAKAMRFLNLSATPVYLGGSDVTTDTTKGYPICTDTAACDGAAFPVDSNPVVYCRAGSSVNLVVMSGY